MPRMTSQLLLWFRPDGYPFQDDRVRVMGRVVLLIVCCLLLAGCMFPGSVNPTVKIGLSAPFEGLDRELGYEALYAVRLAVQQRNDAGGVGASYWVELVALNDLNEPEEALIQAKKMAVDPDLLGTLGGWSVQTARVVSPEYEELGLALLIPEADPGSDLANQMDPPFWDAYLTLSGGVPPGAIAIWAYEAANRLLDAMDTAARSEGRPSRSGVQTALQVGEGK